MGTKSVKAMRYECDGCGRVQVIEKDREQEPPPGVILRGSIDLPSGGCPVDIFLCAPDCVPLSQAIHNSREREMGNE